MNTDWRDSANAVSRKIKASLTMSEYVSHYLELKPAGIGALGLCLFHDDQRPSFGVSDEGNEGTVSHVAAKVPFWVKLRGCDSTAAITKLAEMLLS